MGVRGKLEAVIYAAEEPVTLAQLAGLFGEEALAERDASRGSEQSPKTASLAFSDADEEPSPLPDAIDASRAERDAAAPAPAEGSQTPPIHPFASAGEPVLAEESSVGDAPDADKRAGRLRDRAAREEIRRILSELMAEYDTNERGMEIREIAGGYRVATKPEYHDAVRLFAKSLKPPMKLTLQALETLAVIAYKQPVTAPEISEVRGVDSGGVLGSLISRKLVTTAGRKQVVGRPILYKTTKEFLLRFGLKDLAELPSMEEFEKMAGELGSLGDESVAPLFPAPAPDKQFQREPAISIAAEESQPAGLSVDESGAVVPDTPELLESTGS